MFLRRYASTTGPFREAPHKMDQVTDLKTMLINSNWTQQGLRDLARKLQEYYGVANSPPVEGRAAADACRALQQALVVVKADEGIHAYLQGNFPVGRHTSLGIEERIEQAVKQFEESRQVDGQYVNQVLECLYVLLDVGKLKPYRPERTIVHKAVDRLRGRPTDKQLEDYEEGILKYVGPKLDYLVSAYNRANPT